nr:hypothetical protein [uncultured Cohaesibacter sp.]
MAGAFFAAYLALHGFSLVPLMLWRKKVVSDEIGRALTTIECYWLNSENSVPVVPFAKSMVGFRRAQGVGGKMARPILKSVLASSDCIADNNTVRQNSKLGLPPCKDFLRLKSGIGS